VEGFLQEGAIVHFCSRTQADIDSANETLAKSYSSTNAVGKVVDVSKIDDLRKWVEDCAEQSKRIDVVVPNVSCFHMQDTPEDWQATFHTDMFALWSMIKASLPYLEKTKGNVVTISSVTGRDVGE
jgi:3-oxoacyl-[acyl-carrier protein] reductase